MTRKWSKDQRHWNCSRVSSIISKISLFEFCFACNNPWNCLLLDELQENFGGASLQPFTIGFGWPLLVARRWDGAILVLLGSMFRTPEVRRLSAPARQCLSCKDQIQAQFFESIKKHAFNALSPFYDAPKSLPKYLRYQATVAWWQSFFRFNAFATTNQRTPRSCLWTSTVQVPSASPVRSVCLSACLSINCFVFCRYPYVFTMRKGNTWQIW